MHYQRWKIHGDPNIKMILLPVASCAVVDCERRSAKSGVCWKHYRHFRAVFGDKQRNRCAICGTTEEESTGKKLRLDHNHDDGHPRGLLCHQCNVALGLFKDNTQFLQAAIGYLQNSSSSSSYPGSIIIRTAQPVLNGST